MFFVIRHVCSIMTVRRFEYFPFCYFFRSSRVHVLLYISITYINNILKSSNLTVTSIELRTTIIEIAQVISLLIKTVLHDY
jgi:hypothetical protein